MKKTKKELESKAQEAVRKAAEAVKAANEALAEANTALQIMQALSDEELDQVSGGTGDEGGSSWSGIPTVQEYEYPVIPPNNNP